MPVTIKIASHEANLISRPRAPIDSPESFLEALQYEENPGRFIDKEPTKTHGDILQSSLDGDKLPPDLLAKKNGFVSAAAMAYSHHHHLTIRPEDIWLAIISQLSLYVNKHAEELRGQFVAHAGQKELAIMYKGTRRTVDFADFAQQISVLISESVVDDEICRWVAPAFSTTTEDDVVVANIMMMGTLQPYFRYACMMICGIPSVTLLGTQEDYEAILRRLDKLADYGEEPDAFSDLLRPVVRCLARSFAEPGHPDVRRFWEKICDEHRGSDKNYYSGWITAFCFWNGRGERQVFPRDSSRGWLLEEVGYGRVEMTAVPCGFATVPVQLHDGELPVGAEMIAGSVGVNCTSSGKPSADGTSGLDTMQNHLGWFMYEKP